MLRRLALGILLPSCLLPAERRVAVTVDDLPGFSSCELPRLLEQTRRLLAPFRAARIPLTGFVIAGHCPELSLNDKRKVFRTWTEAGAELGNHTYTHPGLNTTPVEDYERNILQADAALKDFQAGVRYFRSPMLQTGPTLEIKRRLERFLAGHHYQQAPVTFDNSDWMFAYVYRIALERGDLRLAGRVRASYVPYMESIVSFFEQRSVEVVGREIPQILLIHANRLNAEMGPGLLHMLQRRGYRFVSLEEALADDAYRLPNDYAGKGGFSWIHRWSMTKGMPGKGEPDEPAWLRQQYQAMNAATK